MLAGKILEIFFINPISPIKTPNRAKNHWLFFLCMSDAFSDAWGVAKFDEQRAQMARQVEADIPDVDENVSLNLNMGVNQGDCCEKLKNAFANIFGGGTPYEIQNGWEDILPTLESQYGFKPNYLPPQTHTRGDGSTFELEHLEFDWYDGMDCDKVIHFFRNHIQSDLENMTASEGPGPWTYMLNNALEAIQEYEDCMRGGFENVGFSGDFQASGDAFSDAWAVVKMPLVRDSIEYGEPDWKGFPTATALFQHPTNPDVQYRMSAWEDQGGTRMVVNDDEEGRRAGFAYFRTPYPNSVPHTRTSDINTIDWNTMDYRRLGIATAMYDLINEMTKKFDKRGRVVSSPANLSSENTRLWDKALRHSRGFGIEDKNSREQIMWPEKGVYR